MARRKIKVTENSGIDKLELFLQSYFKQLIIGIAAVIVLFIAGYAGFSIHESSKSKKADLVGEAELNISDVAGIKEFISLEAKAPFLKDYIKVRSGEAYVLIGDNNEALNALTGVSGHFKELGEGLAFDLGANMNVEQYIKTGAIKPLWYYRAVLAAKDEDRQKYLDQFKAAYPDNRLLELLENWSM